MKIFRLKEKTAQECNKNNWMRCSSYVQDNQQKEIVIIEHLETNITLSVASPQYKGLSDAHIWVVDRIE